MLSIFYKILSVLQLSSAENALLQNFGGDIVKRQDTTEDYHRTE